MALDINNSVFSLDKLRKIIADKHSRTDKEDRSGPQIAFLPEGVHKIRWFFDPTGELFRESITGKVGRTRFMCPNYAARIDRIGNYPECKICAHQVANNEWRNKCRYNACAYGFLYDTKNSSEYWKPGNAYVILGNSRLKNALEEMLENLIDDGADMLLGMLTPNIKGFVSSTNVTRGNQGNVAIQVLTKTVEPLELDDWYIPLSKVNYMPQEFDPEVYNAAVEEYFEGIDTTTSSESDDDTKKNNDPIVSNTFTWDDDDEEDDDDLADDEDTMTLFEEVKAKVKKRVDEKRETKAFQVALPEGISEDMLPEECPGWSLYNPAQSVCVLCALNLDCMSV